ncbi:hypothetical protein [Streptomyces sp. NPDC053541]|uniref:hypothetical protein n=1 Tax=Streptomyces sp. NPDC053541 TaxID=3365709 RepID=UPI0037D350CC
MGWGDDRHDNGTRSPAARLASGAVGVVVAAGLAVLVPRPELMPWRDAADATPPAAETERPSAAPSQTPTW